MTVQLGDIPDDIKSMFVDVERRLLPTIKARARQLKGVDADDAIQEARIALLMAMTKYDYNKASGELTPYLRTAMTNTCRALLARARLKSRSPWSWVRDGDTWVEVPSTVISINGDTQDGAPAIDNLLADDSAPPDQHMRTHQSAMRVASFRAAMDLRLGDREQLVLAAKLDPSVPLVEQIEQAGGDSGNPSNAEIAQYLGLSKAQIDWSLCKIRSVFTELASEERFSDLFGQMVDRRGWPVVHVVAGQDYDQAFVNKVLDQRSLANEPLSEEVDSCSVGSRSITWYDWGAVITVKRDGRCWTIVAEGTFNPRSGEVFGEYGARRLIGVEGYGHLAKAMSDARRCAMTEVAYKILPHCITEYEKDNVVCDGVDSDKPCVCRDTCVSLLLRMQEKGFKRASYVNEAEDASGRPYCTPRDPDKFALIIEHVRKAYGVKDGVATTAPASVKSAPVASAKAAASPKKAPKKAPAPKKESAADADDKEVRPRSEASVNMDAWYAKWLGMICEATGRTFCDGVTPAAGQFFAKDRRQKSGYIGLYCKPERGRAVAVGYLQYKPRATMMSIEFPVPPGGFLGVDKEIMKVLKPVDISDGCFTSVAKGLGEKEVMMGAQATIQLISSGAIQLPALP